MWDLFNRNDTSSLTLQVISTHYISTHISIISTHFLTLSTHYLRPIHYLHNRYLHISFSTLSTPNSFTQDLVQGVTTVFSQEFFDFYPAVRWGREQGVFIQFWLQIYFLNVRLRGAFRYAKVFSSEGEITENQSIADLTLDFEEFQKFFFALRQYFLYCQVSNKQ